jgi:hypothetical protein
VNGTVVPAAADGFAGVTRIELSTGAMVKVTDAEWVALPLVPVTVIV